MSDCTHHFEHVKQTRPFTEREYMQCTKCGHQNPLGLFQHWDTERDGPAFKWPPRNNGGKLSAGLTTIRNITGHGILVNPYPRQRKRKPIVKVQKTQTGWLWTCRICDHFFMSSKWSIIINSATHHAHNHH